MGRRKRRVELENVVRQVEGRTKWQVIEAIRPYNMSGILHPIALIVHDFPMAHIPFICNSIHNLIAGILWHSVDFRVGRF